MALVFRFHQQLGTTGPNHLTRTFPLKKDHVPCIIKAEMLTEAGSRNKAVALRQLIIEVHRCQHS